jgi:Flp pilus assembly pilin Flp
VIRAFARRLARDRRGATIVEFAIVAPVLLMVIFGVFDLAYTLYATTQLDGAIQRAARESTIEGAGTAQIDANVRAAVHDIVPDATVAITRKVYSDFGDVGRPEDFNDVNGNGACDAGEPFEDVNGNDRWDTDRGRDGQGGARDAVLYQVAATFERPFPVAAFIGLSPYVTATAKTILRNQPFDEQSRTLTVGHCA